MLFGASRTFVVGRGQEFLIGTVAVSGEAVFTHCRTFCGVENTGMVYLLQIISNNIVSKFVMGIWSIFEKHLQYM